MKLKKRVLSALMCVCLVICLFTGTAMADTTDPNTPSTASTTGSITIQNPSNSEATVAGKTFDVYKIFDAKTSGTNVSYDWHVEDNTELFYDYFYASGTGVLEKAPHKNVQTAVNYIAGLNTAYELSQLAESLHIYIESKGYSPCHKVTADNDDTSIVISDLEYGYYLVYDATDLTTNPSAVRSAVMLSDVTKNAVITLKANRPQIEKTVLENDGETYGKGTSTSIGDVVTFKITTAVPSHMHYAKYTYYIEDTMHNGLALKEDSIKVYRNNESLEKELLLENGTDYTIEFPTTGNVDFKVDFTSSIDNFAVNDELSIVYDAVVTSEIEAQKANTNTATLVYSNDPTTDESMGTVSSTANVYSYQMVLSKFAQDTNGTFMNVRLAGAEFQLFEDGSPEPISFIKQTVKDSNDNEYTKYVVVPADTDGAVDTLVVHDTGDATISIEGLNYGGHLGELFIFGLKEGKYNLVETKAPDGYICPAEPFVIEITDEIGVLGTVGVLNVTGSHTGEGRIVNLNGIAESTLTVWAEITNAPGSALPETGGMGTTLFMVLGVVIMAGAVSILLVRRRSRAV